MGHIAGQPWYGHETERDRSRRIASEREAFKANEFRNNPIGSGQQHHWSGGYYQFPDKLGTGEGDLLNWMLFTAYEIVGGYEGTKLVKFGNSSGSVALPIPPGLQANYEQNWNQASVGAAQQGVAQIANKFGVMGKIRGWMDNMGLGAGGGGDTGTGFKEVDKSTMATALALQAAPGLGEVVQATLGVRALDQVIMSYGGPGFRNFNYSYSLKPNNAGDSQAIDDIVRWFKLKSAPTQGGTMITRLYKLPHVFKIQFYTGGEENENLPKVAHCALTNISVQYGGDIFRTYEGTNAPVQVNLTLAFKEMVLLERDSFEERRSSGEFNRGDY